MKRSIIYASNFLLLILWTLFSSLSSNSYNGDPIKKIVKEIAKTGIYEYSTTFNKDAVLPDQMIRYQKLKELASPERLISIIKKNKNEVVRLYAYMALVSSLQSVPEDILQQMNNDQSIVQTRHEHISDSQTVATIAKTFLY